MRFSFRYSAYGPDGLKLGIFPDHYNKSVKVILDLQARLRKIIPFKFRTMKYGAPSVVVMGGRSHRGVLALEMEIIPTGITQAEAIEALKVLGFTQGHEQVAA